MDVAVNMSSYPEPVRPEILYSQSVPEPPVTFWAEFRSTVTPAVASEYTAVSVPPEPPLRVSLPSPPWSQSSPLEPTTLSSPSPAPMISESSPVFQSLEGGGGRVDGVVAGGAVDGDGLRGAGVARDGGQFGEGVAVHDRAVRAHDGQALDAGHGALGEVGVGVEGYLVAVGLAGLAAVHDLAGLEIAGDVLEPVVAVAAGHGIRALAAEEHVGPVAAHQGVGPGDALQGVVLVAAVQQVVGGRAHQGVRAAVAIEDEAVAVGRVVDGLVHGDGIAGDGVVLAVHGHGGGARGLEIDVRELAELGGVEGGRLAGGQGQGLHVQEIGGVAEIGHVGDHVSGCPCRRRRRSARPRRCRRC